MLDKEFITQVVIAAFGGAVGAFVTYLTAILKVRKDLEADFDKDLRVKRLAVYGELWKLLKALPRYDLPNPLTAAVLTSLTVDMRDWYFDTGGMYLSDDARRAYFDLKESIQEAVKFLELHARQDSQAILSEPESTELLERAKLLRAWLTKDVKTRRKPAMADA